MQASPPLPLPPPPPTSILCTHLTHLFASPPPPPEPVSTHELSLARTADPSVLAGSAAPAAASQCSQHAVCRIRARWEASLKPALSVRALQRRAAAAAAAVPRSSKPSQPICSCLLHPLHYCLHPSPACVANPIPTTRANRQHGRRRVMIGTACRTTYTNNTPLGPPMRQPLPSSHAPSPKTRRTTHHTVRPLEPG